MLLLCFMFLVLLFYWYSSYFEVILKYIIWNKVNIFYKVNIFRYMFKRLIFIMKYNLIFVIDN